MKKNKLLWCLFPLVLCACGNSNPNGTISQTEGLYTKLGRAIKKIGSSFSASGSLGYAFYDGTKTTQTNYLVEAEVSENAYYYQEQDLEYDNPIVMENYYKTEEGKFGERVINYTNNSVEEYYTNANYDDIMVNDFGNLAVKNLKVIRDRPNWYNVNDYNLSKSFISFLTGYQVGENALYITQFALHFDGDEIDQFYILLEYTEEEDETTSMMQQYLFELDITKQGETTPRELEAYSEVSAHEKLNDAFYELRDANNYTMHFDVNYADTSIQDINFDYLIDIKNQSMISYELKTWNRLQDVTDEDTGEVEQEYVAYPYYMAYKKDSKTKKPYGYYFDPNTHECLRSYDFNTYMGYSTTTIEMQNLLPYVGLVNAGCYQFISESENELVFGSYQLSDLASISLKTLLPFTEWTFNDMLIKVDKDLNLTLVATETCYIALSEMNYITTECTTTITFSNINKTVMPDYLINA